MRKLAISPALESILLASVVVAPSVYAAGGHDSSEPMMGGMMTGRGMMGDDATKDGGGRMSMMKQMSRMADHCNNMTSDGRLNDQWQKNAPSEPEKK